MQEAKVVGRAGVPFAAEFRALLVKALGITERTNG